MIAVLSPENQRIARRLLAADGYLDLGMPEYALTELDRIGDAGDFEASVQYLRGVALKAQGKFGEAIPHLEDAARLIPAPLCRFAWKSLSECYAAQGETSMAELARMVAQAAESETDDDVDEQGDHSISQPPNLRPHGKLPENQS